jgi:hypothetical protein
MILSTNDKPLTQNIEELNISLQKVLQEVERLTIQLKEGMIGIEELHKVMNDMDQVSKFLLHGKSAVE